MSLRDGSVDLDWADGHYTFRLAWKDLEALQEACDAGPYVILQRLINGTWRLADISNVIRLALIGGGLDPAKALSLTRTYVEARPPAENVMFAKGILTVGVLGPPEEKPGKQPRRRKASA